MSNHYDPTTIAFLSDIWGEGFMSPGGAQEASLVVKGIALHGSRVLGIGYGSGAIAVILVEELGAEHVIGIDVEEPACLAASQRIKKLDLQNKIEIRLVSPGPFDFRDNSFDCVYSKDSIVHIPDKESLSAEVFRILKPGGWFAASDWLISHDEAPSVDMQTYLKAEDLEFGMASPKRYKNALEKEGFINIIFTNRNHWHAEEVKKELLFLTGKEKKRLQAQYGHDFVNDQIDIWKKMTIPVESGELCPHIFRGQKPY